MRLYLYYMRLYLKNNEGWKKNQRAYTQRAVRTTLRIIDYFRTYRVRFYDVYKGPMNTHYCLNNDRKHGVAIR